MSIPNSPFHHGLLGDQLTEQLVRLATNCAAVYHGWGTEK